MVGQTVSHYKVLEKLGEGGMGEVYLAEDTSLKRKVALKVLPEFLQQDPISQKRFIREAQSAAALDHPFICNIHEVGQIDDGQDYIVMEYVEGQTLKQKLEKGRVPLKEALQSAAEIAEALEEAHQKNIIHRDLKPANIMVTTAGHIKVMDFGLAKRIADDEGDITTSLTKKGSTVGTLAYMSPEQLQNKTLDTRCDIFSFGTVLYELLSGVHPFRKEGGMGTANAIISETQAPMNLHSQEIPILLQYVVNKMLAKEPEQRYQVVHNVRTDLRQMLDSGETATELFKTIRVQAVGSKWGWMVLCGFTFFALATAAILFWIHWLSTPLKPNNVSRFTVNLGQGKEIAGTARAMAISPDGKVLVYRAQLGETIKLYRRPLNQLEAIAIPGTDGADAPFFSPDSRKVGFFAGEKLKHVSLADGALVTVCEAENPVGACWAIDDTIFFSPVEGGRGLWSVPATGGVPQQVTQPKSELQHRYPEALPGGKAVLFNAREWGQHYTIRVVVLSLETGEQRVLVENAVMPLYAPSGHLVYSRGSELMAVPFDVKELEVTGSPVKVVEGLRHTTAGESAFSFSSDGALSFVPGGWTGTKNELAWVSRQGTTQPLHEPKTQYVRAALSPDDRQIAAQMSDGVGMDVFLLKIERNTLSRFTFDGRNHIAIWSPVNNRVTFTSNRDVHNNLYWKPADGSGVAERLTTSGYHQDAGSWSPDGTVLAFAELNSATTWDIWLLYLEEDSKVEPFLQNRFSEYAPMISPDGSYLAYVSNESGRREVYVQPFPEGGRRWQISTEVGYDPLWAPNGEELFYCTECDRPDCSKVMAVDVTTEPEFKAGVPRPLFEGPYRAGGGFGHSSYDITSDGQNFLVTSIGIPPPPVTQINVVLNWFEELKHRVPTE